MDDPAVKRDEHTIAALCFNGACDDVPLHVRQDRHPALLALIRLLLRHDKHPHAVLEAAIAYVKAAQVDAAGRVVHAFEDRARLLIGMWFRNRGGRTHGNSFTHAMCQLEYRRALLFALCGDTANLQCHLAYRPLTDKGRTDICPLLFEWCECRPAPLLQGMLGYERLQADLMRARHDVAAACAASAFAPVSRVIVQYVWR